MILFHLAVWAYDRWRRRHAPPAPLARPAGYSGGTAAFVVQNSAGTTLFTIDGPQGEGHS